jgi:hypothetical protein
VTDSDATDEEVRRALRGLADGTAPQLDGSATDGPPRDRGWGSSTRVPRTDSPGPGHQPNPSDADAGVVASDLLASVERAATALAGGGERRLRGRARHGAPGDRRAARTVLRALRRYRRAARGPTGPGGGDAGDNVHRAERF